MGGSWLYTFARTSKALGPSLLPLRSIRLSRQQPPTDSKKSCHASASRLLVIAKSLLARSKSRMSDAASLSILASGSKQAALRLLFFRHSSSSKSTLPCWPSYSNALTRAVATSRKPSSPRALPVISSSTMGSRKAALEPVPGGMRLLCSSFSKSKSLG